MGLLQRCATRQIRHTLAPPSRSVQLTKVSLTAWTQRWTSPYEVCSNLDKHIVRVPD